ncbi:MAG: hypothetical protein HY730_01165 [Candidatus Tectomicrobia bacterium]|uniref:Aldehyde ferredoxin oxidoreductase N-terminal domain-containing protein n=1 Tax=Tectimicrobiota bacterium TaxID=2528274 RepID=A0A933GK92_UNCTE|nr:hypothetical protein [Candidatus Tectomicrobia bacterium]
MRTSAHGYGSILRIDLANRKSSVEEIPAGWKRMFIGGGGINDWLLWSHFLSVDPRLDPRSQDNVLIAGLGPLGATGLGLGSKMKWTFKGPAYGMFGDSVSGGTLSANMRWAGYDYLVITGRAKDPLYLWIDDDEIEFREAKHIWGKGVPESVAAIRNEVNDRDAAVACIGPAGENLVAYASIIVTPSRAAGRCGGGCVAGSKNLKAIAVRGTKGIPVYNPTEFLEVTREVFERLESDPTNGGFRKHGTLGIAGFYDRIGGNAYRNNQSSKVPDEKMVKLHAHWFSEHLKTADLSCSPGCTLGCGHKYFIQGHESELAKNYAGEKGEGPEYFSVATFGMGCDIPDLAAVTHFQSQCNFYGFDIGEIGGIVPFLMELWERGVIDEKDSQRWCGEALSLNWGNAEAVEKIMDFVGYQKNHLGVMLRDGMAKAAQKIMEEKDKPVDKYLITGKGGGTLHEEIRNFPTWALNFAVASRGCDHLKGLNMLDKGFRKDISMAWFGRPEAGKGYCPDLKGMGAAHAENYVAVLNALGVCVFRTAPNPLIIPLEVMSRAYAAMTGVALSAEEMYAAGERICNLEKAFNSRLGLRRQDDHLSYRLMEEPATWGPGKGMKAGDYLEALLDEYYDYHGWDKKTSLQTKQKLTALELDDVAAVLSREGALA